MSISFSASNRPDLPHTTAPTRPAPKAPLLILGDDTPLISTLQARLQEAFPATLLVRTTWIDDTLDRMAAHPADTVFLSDALPQRRALDCARAIKALWPQTRTILVTERRISLGQLLRAEAVDAYLAAPLTEAQLRLALEVVG